MTQNAAEMKNADEDMLASQFPLSIVDRPFLSEISHIRRKKENTIRMESNERYPGVCILYLLSIDHSYRKILHSEEREKTRQEWKVLKVVKDILASSAFSIYRRSTILVGNFAHKKKERKHDKDGK